LYDTVSDVDGQPTQKRPAAGTPLLRLLLWSAVPVLLAGCASPSSSTSAAADLSRALDDYHAKHYAQALERAAAVQRDASGELRCEAAYVGGLSAYRLGDLDEAGAHLDVAAGSASRPTAGRARAVLGLVLLDRDRPAEAAAHFAAAARDLEADNARQAALRAADAFRRAGDEAAAAAWTRIAEGRGRPPDPGAGGAFTLQAGAFRQRPHAEKAALEAARVAEGHGLSPVRIVPRRDDRGSVLYVVQLGRFDSRTEAMSARRQLGRLQYIVAALPPG
jgi:hypothetical protein